MIKVNNLARRLAFLMIYAMDLSKGTADEVVEQFLDPQALETLIRDAGFFDSDDEILHMAERLQCVLTIRHGERAVAEATSAEELYPEDPGAEALLDYVQKTVHGTADHIARLDELINQYAKGWRVERLASVDVNLLRLSIYELLFAENAQDTPIIINEAVALAKVYSEDRSPAFINAILDHIAKDGIQA